MANKLIVLLQTATASADAVALLTQLKTVLQTQGYATQTLPYWPSKLEASSSKQVLHIIIPNEPSFAQVLLQSKWLKTSVVITHTLVPFTKAPQIYLLNCPIEESKKLVASTIANQRRVAQFIVTTKPTKIAWETLGLANEKILVLPPFLASNYTQSEKLNSICTSPINTLNDGIILLKAFSIFKKWQLSSYALNLVVPSKNIQQQLAKQLESYKYKTHVTITSNFFESVASSWLCIGWQIPQKQVNLAYTCFKLQTPIICAVNNSELVPVEWQSFVYQCLPNPDDIGKQLLQAYRNEEQHISFRTLAAQHYQEISEHRLPTELAQLLAI